ncbi:MAG TPA: peptidase, partial [Alloprevotella sp.]|nr:peptidase [Alloprevotella sp.]
MQGLRPSARDAEEVKDQLAAELAGNEPALKLAARKALLKYMNLGPEEEAQGERLLSSSGQA